MWKERPCFSFSSRLPFTKTARSLATFPLGADVDGADWSCKRRSSSVACSRSWCALVQRPHHTSYSQWTRTSSFAALGTSLVASATMSSMVELSGAISVRYETFWKR